jgi:hypothetical protein
MREPNLEKDQKAVPQIYPANRPKSTGLKHTFEKQSTANLPTESRNSAAQKNSAQRKQLCQVLLAYVYAAVRERACRKVARRNRRNQRSQSPILTRREKDDRSVRSGAPAATAPGNYGRTHVPDGMEKNVTALNFLIGLQSDACTSIVSVIQSCAGAPFVVRVAVARKLLDVVSTS